MTEPRTAAGRVLLAHAREAYWSHPPLDLLSDIGQGILAIEAEAAAAAIERAKRIISTRAAVGSLGIGSGAYAAVLAILDAEAAK